METYEGENFCEFRGLVSIENISTKFAGMAFLGGTSK